LSGRCSDCPPAVANVAAIGDRADVLALVFSVDYWDRLGWKDTFSKPDWTARQYAYASAMGHDGVYTPQVIVNGRVEGTGLDANELASLMRSAERGDGGPTVGFSGGTVTVGEAAASGDGADVWLARYDPRVIEVAVKRGENPWAFWGVPLVFALAWEGWCLFAGGRAGPVRP
jgi:hypothetical protein